MYKKIKYQKIHAKNHKNIHNTNANNPKKWLVIL
jgi:hypothetical protein